MLNGMLQNSNGLSKSYIIPRFSDKLIMSIPYKGLMLSEEIQTLHIGHDYGVFRLPGQQIITSGKEYVYLHGYSLPKTIRAHVEETNPNRAWITLSRFIDLPGPWTDRSEDRVQPEKPIFVKIYCGTHRCSASIDNISRTGLGVLVYHLFDRNIKAEMGTHVKVEFPVWEEKQPLRICATVISITPLGRSLTKVGFRIDPNRKQVSTLEKYIHQRKEEIFTELNTDWMAYLEPRNTKDLFF